MGVQRIRWGGIPQDGAMLTPKGVISILGVIGLAFVILGSVFLQLSQEVVELQYQYDGSGSDGDSCKITSSNEGKSCTVSLKATAKMKSQKASLDADKRIGQHCIASTRGCERCRG